MADILKFMHCGCEYTFGNPMGIPDDVFGNGADGNCTLCYDSETLGNVFMEAKEYNFCNFTICEGVKLRFCGQGVPIIRVSNCFTNDGEINLRNPLIENGASVKDIYSGYDICTKCNPLYTNAKCIYDVLEETLTYEYLTTCGAAGGCYAQNTLQGATGGGCGCNGCSMADGCGGTGGACGICAGGGGGGSNSTTGHQGQNGCDSPGEGIGGAGGAGGGAGGACNFCAGNGGGGGFGYCQGGKGGNGGAAYGSAGMSHTYTWAGVGGNGGNSYMGNGGDGGDITGGKGGAGRGGDTRYGKGGNGGCWSGATNPSGAGGNSYYGDGGCGGNNASGGCSMYGCGSCAIYGDGLIWGINGCCRAWQGVYGLGLFVNNGSNNGCINGKGGDAGSNSDNYPSDGGEIYVVSKGFSNTGGISYKGGCSNYNRGCDGVLKIVNLP